MDGWQAQLTDVLRFLGSEKGPRPSSLSTNHTRCVCVCLSGRPFRSYLALARAWRKGERERGRKEEVRAGGRSPVHVHDGGYTKKDPVNVKEHGEVLMGACMVGWDEAGAFSFSHTSFHRPTPRPPTPPSSPPFLPQCKRETPFYTPGASHSPWTRAPRPPSHGLEKLARKQSPSLPASAAFSLDSSHAHHA